VAGHSAIDEVIRHNANRYALKRRDAADREVFLTNVYILGEADYARLIATHPDVDLIVLASTWNACTMDVKEAAMDDGIAIHNFPSLMRALVKRDDDDFVEFGYSPTDRFGNRLNEWRWP
jgi:hypothetical protein